MKKSTQEHVISVPVPAIQHCQMSTFYYAWNELITDKVPNFPSSALFHLLANLVNP